MEIYLLRHGRTTQPGTYTGISDVQLSKSGEEQVSALSSLFSSHNFDRCYSSPLIRCRSTFEALGIDNDCVYDERLREINFGQWEGLTFKQVETQFPGQLDLWKTQKQKFHFPNGDLLSDFSSRIEEWFEELLRGDFERVLIVSHGGVIRVALCHLLGIGNEFLFSFTISEATVSMVAHEHGFARLELLNCRGY